MRTSAALSVHVLRRWTRCALTVGLLAIGNSGFAESLAPNANSGSASVVDDIATLSDPHDLDDDAMIIRATADNRDAILADVAGRLATGFNNFEWDGPGINSSAAAADVTDTSGIGFMINDNGLGGPFYSTFGGQAAGINDILLAYTLYGDADLNGVVDGTDVVLLDNGFNSGLTGWFNGDFDFNGVIDNADYDLLYAALPSTGGAVLASSLQAVPEPASITLLVLGLLSLLTIKLRRSK